MSAQRYHVIPDHLAALQGKPLTYLVVDTDVDDPGVVCTTTDYYAGRIATALNDWGKCDRLHDEIHRMGVAREEQRQKTAARISELETALAEAKSGE